MILKNKKGESFVELLISIGLISLLAVVFLYTFTYLVKRNINLDNTLNATYVCQQRAEHLYSTSQDMGSYMESELLDELQFIYKATFLGPLVDSANRNYEKVYNNDNTALCKKYVINIVHGPSSEYSGFTERITIYFSYYYGNLSKVVIEAWADEDYSKIETTYSWYNKT